MTQDERIHDDVCRQLMWQTDIQSNEIVVAVKNSAVVLSGRVETCLESREAESAAKAAYGVSSVTNNIRIEPKRTRSDQEIAGDITAHLQRITCVLEEIPSVTVREGIATLRGQVRWNFQRNSAERATEAVVGVLRVRNLVAVVPLDYTYTVTASCRQLSRIRPENTQSQPKHETALPTESCDTMYFVPSVVGRA
jgi:osmotically-inducible protein OsmY